MLSDRLIAVDVGVSLIPQVVRYAAKIRANTNQSVSVVFPNRRAGRFFLHALPKELVLDVIPYSIDQLIDDAILRYMDNPPTFVTDLDRCFLVMNFLKERFPDLYGKLGGEADRVFPWSIRLVRLLDELDMNLVEQVDAIPYADEVVPEAREILGRLDAVVSAYRMEMERSKWTGGGNRYLRVQEVKDQQRGPLLIAGFAGMTGGEYSFLKDVWDREEAWIMFQTDLHGRHDPFEPYRVHDEWLSGKRWGRKPDRRVDGKQLVKPEVIPVESFDVHSQVSMLSSVLARGGRELEKTPTSAAVVVPDTRSLVPVLQGIPQKKLNVTAGYPFHQTGFYRLLIQIMQLAENRKQNGDLDAKLTLHVLSNPLLAGLLEFRPAAHEAGSRSAPIQDILAWNMPVFSPEVLCQRLREEISESCATVFSDLILPLLNVRSVGELAIQLERLVIPILADLNGRAGMETETELIAHFMESIHRQFALCHYRDQKFRNVGVLAAILRQISEQVQIQFEGNPLEGLQVMGFLETRLLGFDHVFIIDVNEASLPSDYTIDPLLPVSLRESVGLPSTEKRESIEAYHFFRLIDGARQVHLFYRRGDTAETRSIRSRFVEQLLVEWERAESLIQGSVDPVQFEQGRVQVSGFRLSPHTSLPEDPPVLDSVHLKRLDRYRTRGISPSFLDELITCPYRFYLKRLACLPEESEILKRQDPRHVGQVVHDALEKAFQPFMNRSLHPELVKQVESTARAILEGGIEQELPGLSLVRRHLLKKLADFRLTMYFSMLRKQLSLEEITVVSVEEKVEADWQNIRLSGRCDRIDWRKDRETGVERFVVCDYKTGSTAKTPSTKLKSPGDWIGLMEEIGSMRKPEGLMTLSTRLNSIQLPLYGFLVATTRGEDMAAVDSELFLLGSGETSPFCCATMGSAALERILAYLLGCLEEGFVFFPNDATDCPYCPYYRICRYTSHNESRLKQN